MNSNEKEKDSRRGFLEKSSKILIGAGLLGAATPASAAASAAASADRSAATKVVDQWTGCGSYPAISYPCPVEPSFGKCRTFFVEHLRKADGNFDPHNFGVKVPSMGQLQAEVWDVFDASDLDPEQAALGRQFDFGPATLQFEHFVREYLYIPYGFSPPRVARIQAYLNAAMADGFTVTWNFKYQYKLPRPVQLRTDLRTLVQTPGHPTWPSGHSTVAGAAEAILSYFFPAQSEVIHQFAEACAYARQIAGVHYPCDDNDGLIIGRVVGALAAKRAAADGFNDEQGLKKNAPRPI